MTIQRVNRSSAVVPLANYGSSADQPVPTIQPIFGGTAQVLAKIKLASIGDPSRMPAAS